MIKETMQVYLADKNQQFERIYFSLIERIEDEQVHEIRVCIKKMRSLMRFFDSEKVLKSANAKYRNELRQLYRAAGQYRELQIFLNLVSAYEAEKNLDLWFLKEHLVSKKNKLAVPLATILNKFDFENHVDISGNLFVQLNGVNPKKVKSSFEKHLKKLGKQSDKLLLIKRTEWHELRKIIKDIYYLYPVAVKTEESTFLDYLKQTTDRLGLWNDCVTFVKYLNDYVILHEIFDYESRLHIHNLTLWLKIKAAPQVKGIKKKLRNELYTVQKYKI